MRRVCELMRDSAAILLEALVIALLLSVLTARAQTAAPVPECEPQSQWNANALGSPYVLHMDRLGVAGAWWCGGIVGGKGVMVPFIYGGRWSDGWAAVPAAAERVAAAASPWSQFGIERNALALVLPAVAAGSVEECERRLVRHRACVVLRTTAFDPPFPAAISRDAALLPGACGPAPVCTAPPPPPAWVVDVGTDATKTTRPAFALVNGVRATISTGRATSGQPCRPEVAQAPSLTTGTVWAAFGPAYSPGMVALCRKP